MATMIFIIIITIIIAFSRHITSSDLSHQRLSSTTVSFSELRGSGVHWWWREAQSVLQCALSSGARCEGATDEVLATRRGVGYCDS